MDDTFMVAMPQASDDLGRFHLEIYKESDGEWVRQSRAFLVVSNGKIIIYIISECIYFVINNNNGEHYMQWNFNKPPTPDVSLQLRFLPPDTISDMFRFLRDHPYSRWVTTAHHKVLFLMEDDTIFFHVFDSLEKLVASKSTDYVLGFGCAYVFVSLGKVVFGVKGTKHFRVLRLPHLSEEDSMFLDTDVSLVEMVHQQMYVCRSDPDRIEILQ
jgi:hypothetical protein